MGLTVFMMLIDDVDAAGSNGTDHSGAKDPNGAKSLDISVGGNGSDRSVVVAADMPGAESNRFSAIGCLVRFQLPSGSNGLVRVLVGLLVLIVLGY